MEASELHVGEAGAQDSALTEADPPEVTMRSGDGAKGLDGPPAGRDRRRSAVCVRLAEERDRQDISQLVRRHHRRTIFSGIPLSETKLEALVRQAMQPVPNQCVLIAEAKGRLVGGAWFSAGEYMLADGALMTTVHLLAVDAERCGPYLSAKVFLRLLRGIRLWSDSANAGHVFVHVTTGTAIKPTDRLLRAAGASFIGGGYVFR